MSDLLIRDISEPMKHDIAERAKQAGRSLSEEAKELLQKALIAEKAATEGAGVSAWDLLRPILYDGDDAAATEYARIMDEIEAERKTDFGRPVEDFE
ncbi:MULTISPECIES: plasmid stabilization protein [unclassified Rhizobium]|uniref:FitA-like ribbon-helix-helix domain-containing protein n=1 Tax=unclassified Rhizobium TaxID=2613769 RepID=UPI000EA83BAB|nr:MULTISPECIES: plasmid stabilization protein [unclassified Rhizobium]AYG68038.1 plasmid stabilization protein [Rhizobium sp. CCGE531]AYG74424.1 plasmid stabilization protein [Rhizobium sp. CCGE532]